MRQNKNLNENEFERADIMWCANTQRNSIAWTKNHSEEFTKRTIPLWFPYAYRLHCRRFARLDDDTSRWTISTNDGGDGDVDSFVATFFSVLASSKGMSTMKCAPQEIDDNGKTSVDDDEDKKKIERKKNRWILIHAHFMLARKISHSKVSHATLFRRFN